MASIAVSLLESFVGSAYGLFKNPKTRILMLLVEAAIALMVCAVVVVSASRVERILAKLILAAMVILTAGCILALVAL
jgi:hypothetical protein